MVRAYLLGLGLIAALALAGFFAERYHILQDRHEARIVEVAADQLRLTTQVSLLTLRLTDYGYDRVTRHLEHRLHAALDQLVANHAALLHGDPARDIPPAAGDVRTHLLEPPTNVDARLRDFIGAINALLPRLTLSDGEAAAEADRIIANARSTLAPALEHLVDGYEARSRAKLRRLVGLQQTFIVAVLATILVEIVFVFRPMARQIGADVDALAGAYGDLSRQNRRDDLTGIGNRRALMETLAQTPPQGRAVLQVDLDHFKTVNDLLGHATGDAVLVAVAAAMRAVVRSDDRAFRVGGDEFVVVLDGEVSAEIAGLRAEALLREIADRLPEAAAAAGVSASIGIAVYPDTESAPERLLTDADIALAEAKAEGRNGYRLFASVMREPVETRQEVEREFGRALDRGELTLHFQPQVDLVDGRLVGLEGLARWRRADGDVWGADRFIPHVEDTPLVVAAAAAFVERALTMAVELRRRGITGTPVSINVADLQLRDPAFADALLRQIDDAALPADALGIELVERALLGRGQEQVAAQLDRLHQAGVWIDLDDFGTGHASLTHLKTFPVSRIKLDRSFVGGIGRARGDETIVRATIEIAASFGLKVVAEGVETEAQRRFLVDHGCAEGQGYLFAPPLAPSALLRWIDVRGAAPVRRALTPP